MPIGYGTLALFGVVENAVTIGGGLLVRKMIKPYPDWEVLAYGGKPKMDREGAKQEFAKLQGQAMPIKIAKALNVAMSHPELLACMPQRMTEDGQPIDDKLLPELYAAARCRQFNNDFLKEGGL